MYLRLKSYLLTLIMVLFIGCSATDDIKDAVNGDEEVVTFSGESLITEMKEYKTAYFTGFTYQNGNNFFQDSNGILHLTFVDNYELYYAKSTDNGKTWAKEKIETGHDGDLRRASLTVDSNGKVFIGYVTHNKFNYANETSVSYGTNFEYDLYCATNKSGDWTNELLYTHENGTTGREVTGIDVDKDDNIHMFVGYYGWWSYGGTAYEYVRSSETNSWKSIQIAKFTDTSVDKFIYGYYRSHIDENGDITLLFMRQGSNIGIGDKLVYVKKQNGVWGTVVDIDTPTRTAYSSYQFDSATDSDNHIYLAYVKNNNNGEAQILFSKDFGTVTPIYISTIGINIQTLKLHSDKDGNLTLLVNNSSQKPLLLTKSANGSWSSAVELETTVSSGLIRNVALAHTDTAKNEFNKFKISYIENDGDIPSGYGSFGPYKLYFYANSNSFETTTSDVISKPSKIIIDHYNGVDFSANSTGADGYTTTWSKTGKYIDGESYGSGLWYSNNLTDDTKTYEYIQSLGDVSFDSVNSVNTTAWQSYGSAIEALKVNNVYIVKTEDGYVKFKVSSLDKEADNWNFTAEYQFSSTTTF